MMKLNDSYLQELWVELRIQYFQSRLDLDLYSVKWSTRRQKRTLASCNIRGKKIRVAKELNHPSCIEWHSPLLFHEMCHAFLGDLVSKKKGKRQWHGDEFKALEAIHPQMNNFHLWCKNGGWVKAVRRERALSWWSKKQPFTIPLHSVGKISNK
jgi:hypothetical protein